MVQELYFGEYVKFYAEGKQAAADFLGADNLVGDAYEIDIHDEGTEYRAYLVNRFGKTVGYLEDRAVRNVQLAQAKGWVTVAYLSFVALAAGKGEEEPGYHWGEVALLAYDEKLSDVMKPFRAKLSKTMADGGRPQVDFGSKSVDALITGKGTWFPTDKAPRPKLGKGSSMVKDHRTPNERLIEQSRNRNKGCYVISWAFIIGVVALFVFILHSCGVF